MLGPTPILAKDYLMKDMYKSNRPPTVHKLSELVEHFAMLNQHEHLSCVETEEADTSQRTVQQLQHTPIN